MNAVDIDLPVIEKAEAPTAAPASNAKIKGFAAGIASGATKLLVGALCILRCDSIS